MTARPWVKVTSMYTSLSLRKKGKHVPKFMRSILYYITEPPDGKWEINLPILKTDKDLFHIQSEKGLNRKVVSADS